MFLVCGEALMDVFTAGETETGLSLDARIGGSPLNVAIGLARLAQPVAFLSSISRGLLGERLARALSSEGVDISTVERIDAPTTLGLVELDARGVPAYAFYGEKGADLLLGVDALEAIPAAVHTIQLGSYTTVVEPIATTLRSLVERARGRWLVAYDPNARPTVEPDRAVWRRLLDWMMPRTDLLKISDEDLAWLRPGEAPKAFAADALAKGVALVVVTRGGEGALGWTATAHAQAAPVRVEVVDTVGAGDTFQAALLTWLAEHDRLSATALSSLEEAELASALKFATAAAAITCSRRGADLPRRGELG